MTVMRVIFPVYQGQAQALQAAATAAHIGIENCPGCGKGNGVVLAAPSALPGSALGARPAVGEALVMTFADAAAAAAWMHGPGQAVGAAAIVVELQPQDCSGALLVVLDWGDRPALLQGQIENCPDCPKGGATKSIGSGGPTPLPGAQLFCFDSPEARLAWAQAQQDGYLQGADYACV